jgi:hypothetical protein
MQEKTRKDWEREREALLETLYEYAGLLKSRPFDNEQGLRGVSAFALYWFLKKVKPTIVLEVGVWRGFSTWIIEQAAPRADIVCFDPIFFLEWYLDKDKFGATYRSSRAAYDSSEFSCADVARMIAGHERPCVFFDDHQHKIPRLLQCRAFGIRTIIFDDNVDYPYTHDTFETARKDPARRAVMEREIRTYEIFPALWDVDGEIGGQRLKYDGLGFPLDDKLLPIYHDRLWHSCVSLVTLNDQPSGAAPNLARRMGSWIKRLVRSKS